MNIYQVLIGVLVGCAATVAFYSRSREEGKLEYSRLKPGRRTCLIEPLMLPVALLTVLLMMLIFVGVSVPVDMAARLCLLFVHISVYYALLLLLLPLLRRIISARACAALWLVPTLLYFFIWLIGHEMKPLLVVTLPRRYLSAFIITWACGFTAVMLWQIASHLRFRRILIRDTVVFENAEALAWWRNEARRHGIRAEIPVLVSASVYTPLTIGCFERTMRLILPKRIYTDSELELIFRHELRHIVRCDTRTKLFLSFCAAMCWFNPLAWAARRKVADDLELSCDEAVLEKADEDTRKKYADLLLDSVGNGRGYTTCLSAAAGTLRYRLRNVLKPRKRLSGGLLVGFSVLALILTFGAVALADVRTIIFDRAPSDLTLARVTVNNWPGEVYGYRSVYGYDAAALTEYISSLNVRQVYVGNYTEDTKRQLYVDYAEVVDGKTAGLTHFELCDGLLFVNFPYDDSGAIAYISDDEIDWGYIGTLLDFNAPDPDPAPHPPDMTVSAISGDASANAVGSPLYAAKRVIILTDADGTWTAEYSEGKTEFRLQEPGDESRGTHYLYDDGNGIGGFFGAELNKVILAFSYDPVDYTVLVENWDRSESYIIHSDELENDVLPLAPYSAHYTVSGSFDTVRNTHYEMEFYFDIGLPVDAASITLRIIDGADTPDGAEGDKLILAGTEKDEVYFLDAKDIPIIIDGKNAQLKDLQDGMPIDAYYEGDFDNAPLKQGNIVDITSFCKCIKGYSGGTDKNPGGTLYDLSGLYLKVLNDLWEVSDGSKRKPDYSHIEYISVDLSKAPSGLTEGEKSAVAYIFANAKNKVCLQLSYEELVEEGYIKKGEALWENGLLFRITDSKDVEETYNGLRVVKFNAQKWWSGLGAYEFFDCTASWSQMGTWSYDIGGMSIS